MNVAHAWTSNGTPLGAHKSTHLVNNILCEEPSSPPYSLAAAMNAQKAPLLVQTDRRRRPSDVCASREPVADVCFLHLQYGAI